MRTQTKFVVFMALAVGANLGYMLGAHRAEVPVVSQAKANGLVVQPSGEIVTSSPDGTKLYVWYPANNAGSYRDVKYTSMEFTHGR